MVSGIDLVEWQLRVAAGEPLPLTQPQLTLSGHAFEARVYAERPEAGFLPGSGTVYHLRTPATMGDTYVGPATRASAAGHAVRLDTAIVEGDEVPSPLPRSARDPPEIRPRSARDQLEISPKVTNGCFGSPLDCAGERLLRPDDCEAHRARRRPVERATAAAPRPRPVGNRRAANERAFLAPCDRHGRLCQRRGACSLWIRDL